MELKIVKWPKNGVTYGMKDKQNENGNGMKNNCHWVENAECKFVN